MLVSDVIEYGARKHPDKTALRFESDEISYRELADRSRRLANALAAVGRHGDRVAILAPNCAEYFDCYYGVPMAGMALTILNFRLADEQLVSMMNDAEPTVLIVAEELAGIVGTVRQQVPSVSTVVVLGGRGDDGWHAFVGGASSRPPAVRPTENDIAWIVYTSGTTGPPKGVTVTHRNLVSGITSSALDWEVPQDTVFLFCFPLCHIGGYTPMMMHLIGCTVGIMRSYDNESFLQLVDQWRVTQTGLAPTMINFLLKDPRLDEYDLGTLDAIGYGTSAIPAAVLREGLERLGVDFYQGMGMTELVGNILHFGQQDHRRAANGEPHLLEAAGKPMRLVDVRIVDDDLVDVPVGGVGEVIVRCDQVTAGYWRKPEATAEAFTNDGWFLTGDLARQDAEGFVYIVDRKKDLIITGGENVASLAVEQALYRIPAVAEAAAVGIPDETWGEAVCAVVVVRDGAEATADDIIAASREHLAGFQVPRRIRFVDQLPKNVAGKTLKRDLRAMFATQSV